MLRGWLTLVRGGKGKLNLPALSHYPNHKWLITQR